MAPGHTLLHNDCTPPSEDTCGILRDEDVKVPPDLLLAHAAGLHDRLHVIVPQHGLAVAGAHH